MDPIASPLSDIKPRYDVVVIGSGYGGGIAASRLARAGRRVCLLERGREFLLGEFPDTPAEAIRELQLHTPEGHLGSRVGLYDIHVAEQQNVVVGCGLGGTSLINAGVSMEPDPEVFADPAWPEEIRRDRETRLRDGFARARQMLAPRVYPADAPRLPKTAAHRRSAEALGGHFYPTPINVTFAASADGRNPVGVEQPPCVHCGDCVSGCNYGAKNTVQMNYLPDAWNHGAEIFCQAAVRYLERAGDGWRVHYQPLEMGRERFNAPTLFVEAEIVVLCAGTLGSNEILLRSRARGLTLSDRLGKGFSGNGDILGFGYNCDQPVNGVGFGHRPPGELDPVGPCITSVIDLRQGNARDRQMVIEEGSIPGAVGPLLPTLLATAAGLIGEDTDRGLLDRVGEQARVAESLLHGPYAGAVRHTQTFLIMSHDDGRGEATLEDDRLKIRWPDVGRQPNFLAGNENLRAATAALGGEYVENPLWTPLFKQSLVTVHPLGGCNLAADGRRGVVNHKGQVFSGAGTAVHPGLYVADGAIVPTALAINPLLTISALAERCCALMAEEHGWPLDYRLPSTPTRAHPVHTTGIRFTEAMTGHFAEPPAAADDDLDSYRTAAARGRAAGQTLRFTLTIEAENLDALLDNPEHPARISGTVQCPALSERPLTVSDGHFNLFERIPAPPDTRKMRYRLRLTGERGQRFYFEGYKLIKDDPAALDLWADTTTLYVAIHRGEDADGALLGKGVLRIRPLDFARQLTTLEAPRAPSAAARLEAVARFGTFFAGVLYESYGGLFYAPGARVPRPPRKKRPLRTGTPEFHPVVTEDGVALRLTRYRGGAKGPVMLVHGLGVGSTIFSTDLIETNLLEYLVAQGYDVWLLDNRVSILLPAAEHPSNGDQLARYDYPAAVAKIRALTGAASLQAVVHCYGATTFFMAMLAGLSGVRSIVCSQIATDLRVPPATALKTGLHLPDFLERLGVDSLTARVPERSSLLARLYDKALGLNALVQAQGQCHSDTCHRITFLYGSLYRHETLTDRLHSHLDELFGEANMETFEHLAMMCRRGTLVDARGQDVYLPHLERLDLPILFLSGAQNQCYRPESTRLTYQRLRQRFDPDQYARHEIPGYGHIDCIFGRDAVRDVYPRILAHLERTAIP